MSRCNVKPTPVWHLAHRQRLYRQLMGLPLKPLESPSLDSARQHAIPGLVAQDYHVQYCVAVRSRALPVRCTKELERVGRCVEQAPAHRRVRGLPAQVMEADATTALHARYFLTGSCARGLRPNRRLTGTHKLGLRVSSTHAITSTAADAGTFRPKRHGHLKRRGTVRLPAFASVAFPQTSSIQLQLQEA